MCTQQNPSNKKGNTLVTRANKPCLFRQTNTPREPVYSQHREEATSHWNHLRLPANEEAHFLLSECAQKGKMKNSNYFLQAESSNWKVNPELMFVIHEPLIRLSWKTQELPEKRNFKCQFSVSKPFRCCIYMEWKKENHSVNRVKIRMRKYVHVQLLGCCTSLCTPGQKKRKRKKCRNFLINETIMPVLSI